MIQKLTFIFLCFLCACSSFNIKEDRDDFGRVNKIYYYDGNKLLHTENISYYGKTRKPKIVVYKKEINKKMVPYQEEFFVYNGDILTRIDYFLYKNMKKIKTGSVYYFVRNSRLYRVAYYGYRPIKNRIGLDYYLYDSKKKISSRRIITYKYNIATKKTQQTGHYVIKFKNNIIDLMEYSYIKQSKNGAHVEKKVWHKKRTITKKLKQVSQALINRTKGLD